jgi:hypothetical protein
MEAAYGTQKLGLLLSLDKVQQMNLAMIGVVVGISIVHYLLIFKFYT